jgi:hypothetical protein
MWLVHGTICHRFAQNVALGQKADAASNAVQRPLSTQTLTLHGAVTCKFCCQRKIGFDSTFFGVGLFQKKLSGIKTEFCCWCPGARCNNYAPPNSYRVPLRFVVLLSANVYFRDCPTGRECIRRADPPRRWPWFNSQNRNRNRYPRRRGDRMRAASSQP